MVRVLLELSEDEAGYCSFDTSGRMLRDGSDTELNVHFFLVSLGEDSTIFNGESHVKKVNRSRGDNLCDIPFQHSTIVDIVGKLLAVSS